MNRPSRENANGGFETAGVDERLESVRKDSGLLAVVLLDDTGAVLAAASEVPEFDPILFASLASTHVTAAMNLASLVGPVEFRALVQQGAETTIVLSSAANRVLASVHEGTLAPAEITPRADMGARLLAELMQAGASEKPEDGPSEPEWQRAAEGTIDRIMREGE